MSPTTAVGLRKNARSWFNYTVQYEWKEIGLELVGYHSVRVKGLRKPDKIPRNRPTPEVR